VVSSGIYERFFIQDGIRYHHILNPFTGYPVSNHLYSVTVVTNQSIEADALSTTLFSLGLEKGLVFAESLEDVEAFFITDEHLIYTTTGFADQLHITDASYSQYKK
jgi:thiamine biosynthesis lipoprotein